MNSRLGGHKTDPCGGGIIDSPPLIDGGGIISGGGISSRFSGGGSSIGIGAWGSEDIKSSSDGPETMKLVSRCPTLGGSSKLDSMPKSRSVNEGPAL